MKIIYNHSQHPNHASLRTCTASDCGLQSFGSPKLWSSMECAFVGRRTTSCHNSACVNRLKPPLKYSTFLGNPALKMNTGCASLKIKGPSLAQSSFPLVLVWGHDEAPKTSCFSDTQTTATGHILARKSHRII